MGNVAASGIAQRELSALIYLVYRRMDELEEEQRDAEHPAVHEWLAKRRALKHDAFGTQARCYGQNGYTDDWRTSILGPPSRVERFLCVVHDIIGTDAAALILGAWKKQGAGAHALWLGAWSAPMLLSPDKAVRVAERGAAAIKGHLSLEDF